MEYLSSEAIRDAILDSMEAEGIDEHELAERLDESVDEVRTYLSGNYDFSIIEIDRILYALDLCMRFELAPF